MKKQFLNLGKALNKAEQKEIFGGVHPINHEGDPCQASTEPGHKPGGCICINDFDCASSTCLDGKCF